MKLVSGDPTWCNLTALDYHFWTQPLPTPLAWYAAQLPHGVLAAATAATLLIELGLVFLIWLPRRPRAVAAWGVLVFQLIILLTGNYGFFNLLAMLLCVFLFDDAVLRRVMPTRLAARIELRAPHPGRVATAVAAGLALVVLPVGLNRIWQPLTGMGLPLASTLTEAISPLLIVNPYGLFATTTTTRPEIIIEGSDDGQIWREYVFRYKRGPVTRGPTWNIPHQPLADVVCRVSQRRRERLVRAHDPSAAEGQSSRSRLAGRQSVSGPPAAVRPRAALRQSFADPDTYVQIGQWWVRRLEGLYLPRVSLSDFSRDAPTIAPPLPGMPRRLE